MYISLLQQEQMKLRMHKPTDTPPVFFASTVYLPYFVELVFSLPLDKICARSIFLWSLSGNKMSIGHISIIKYLIKIMNFVEV